MNIVFIGPPGSGKGEQATRLAKSLNLAYLSLGDFLREKAKEDSSEGRLVHQMINVEGRILSDELTNKLTLQVLEKMAKKNGVIFDGYPRTIGQFEAFKKYLQTKGEEIDKVIYLNVSRETAIRRLSSRRICPRCQQIYNLVTDPPKIDNICDRCQTKLDKRQDETPEAIKTRLVSYSQLTAPLIEVVRREGILVEVDGERPMEVIFEEIILHLTKQKDDTA